MAHPLVAYTGEPSIFAGIDGRTIARILPFATLTFVVLLLCWWFGDFGARWKLAFTGLWLASLFMLMLDPLAQRLFPVVQCLLILVIGGATFGFDWLTRR